MDLGSAVVEHWGCGEFMVWTRWVECDETRLYTVVG
jgi:hypothetical protein